MMEDILPPYPKEILPNPSYKIRIDVDELLSVYPNLLVVRRIEGCAEEFSVETRNGDKEYYTKLFNFNMANLSLNLAGGLFDTDSNAHLRFMPTRGLATELWDGKDIESFMFEVDNYSVSDMCFGLCFFVSDIHRKWIPFNMFFMSEGARNTYEQETIQATIDSLTPKDIILVGAFARKRGPVKVYGRTKVNHMPTKANYWHITLDSFRPNEKVPVSPESKISSDHRMFVSLKQHLAQCCEINVKPDYCIDPIYYTY